jgi:hypothetical protein
MRFLRQRTKSVLTTDLSVKATNKSVERTVFSQLEHKLNFLLAQQTLFFGVAGVIDMLFGSSVILNSSICSLQNPFENFH